jgi:hypothetical protein
MKNLFMAIAYSLSLFVLGCGGSSKNKAMSLEFFDKIYVPLDPTNVLAASDALKAKGYGNWTNAKAYTCIYQKADFDGQSTNGLAIYTDQQLIPIGKPYEVMRVREFYETAVKTANTAGIVVNPGHNTYTMTKAEIQEAIPKLKQQPPLPKDIYRTVAGNVRGGADSIAEPNGK